MVKIPSDVVATCFLYFLCYKHRMGQSGNNSGDAEDDGDVSFTENVERNEEATEGAQKQSPAHEQTGPETSSSAGSIYCPNCGTMASPTDSYCVSCGAEIPRRNPPNVSGEYDLGAASDSTASKPTDSTDGTAVSSSLKLMSILIVRGLGIIIALLLMYAGLSVLGLV